MSGSHHLERTDETYKNRRSSYTNGLFKTYLEGTKKVWDSMRKLLVDNCAPGKSPYPFSVTEEEGDLLRFLTPVGTVVARPTFVGEATGHAKMAVRVVFFLPPVEGLKLPAQEIYAIRLRYEYEVTSGDDGTQPWPITQSAHPLTPATAERLGNEITAAVLRASAPDA